MSRKLKTPPRLFGSALFWGSVSAALLICAGYIGWQAMQQRDVLTQQAFETARMAHIVTATGKITAVPPVVPAPEPPAPEPAAPEPVSEPAPAPAPETPSAETPAEGAPLPVEPTPAEQPAADDSSAPPDSTAAPASKPEPPHGGAATEAEKKTPPTTEEPAVTEAAATREPVAMNPTPPTTGTSGGSGLADAPAEGFYEQTPQGLLPMVASDGTKPWHYYARPFVRTPDRPMIALLITGVGLNRQASDLAAELPDAVSLSLSGYSADIGARAKALRTGGHEILLDLPLEPVGYPAVDPGPGGLLVSLTPEKNVDNLKQLLGKVPGYVGVTIPSKERFTGSREAAYPVMQHINRRGLIFVLATIPDKSVEELFKYNSFPYLASDLVIDQDLSPAMVNKQLAQLEDIARRQGYAIGTARALPMTLQQIQRWAETLPQRSIDLAPISAIAKTRYK